MGRGDNRKSLKMIRLTGKKRKAARLKRQGEVKNKERNTKSRVSANSTK